MSDTPYFDAYMKGARSQSYKWKTFGPVAGFDPILISLIRRSMPNLFASDLHGVQPMSTPTGQTFTLYTEICRNNLIFMDDIND